MTDTTANVERLMTSFGPMWKAERFYRNHHLVAVHGSEAMAISRLTAMAAKLDG